MIDDATTVIKKSEIIVNVKLKIRKRKKEV